MKQLLTTTILALLMFAVAQAEPPTKGDPWNDADQVVQPCNCDDSPWQEIDRVSLPQGESENIEPLKSPTPPPYICVGLGCLIDCLINHHCDFAGRWEIWL